MQQVVRKVFQIRDADAPVTAVPLVQLLGFEVAAMRGFDFLPGIIFRWLVAGGWWLVGTRSWLRVLSVDLGDAAAKICELLLKITHACCDSTSSDTCSHSARCLASSVRLLSNRFETRRLSSALT